MVTRQQVQGDYPYHLNHVQSPEVSSSTSSDPARRRGRMVLAIQAAQPLVQEPQQYMLFPARRISYRPRALGVAILESNNLNVQTYGFQHPYVVPRYIAIVERASTKGSIFAIAGIFLSALLVLWWIYSGFPDLEEDERQYIKIPWNLEDAKNLGTVLYRYKGDHFYHVYFGVSIMYIFLQAFAIPGSLFLSILSGFLFSFFQAMFLISTCSALGASLCFLFSQVLGRRLIFKYFPDKARAWGQAVNKHRDNLLNYVIFLRVTPFLPNWFINLTAPVIGVPLVPFALGTWLGVIPPSFFALQAGQTLHTISADEAGFTMSSFLMLVVFGGMSLLPIYFKESLREKFD